MVTRSFAYANAQLKATERRLALAEKEIVELPEPKQGKSRPKNMEEYQLAVEKILERRQVKGLLLVNFETIVYEKPVRRYGDNPKRKTHRPSAPLIRQAFSNIILTIIHDGHSHSYYLTPLSDTQSHLLQLLGFDDSLFLSLIQDHSWNLDTYLHEP